MAAVLDRGPCGSEGEAGGPCAFGGERRGSRSFGRVNGRGPHGFEGEEGGPCGFGEKRKDHAVSKEKREDHLDLECSFLPRSLGSRRDFARKKRGERTLAGGP